MADREWPVVDFVVWSLQFGLTYGCLVIVNYSNTNNEQYITTNHFVPRHRGSVCTVHYINFRRCMNDW